MQPPAAPSRAGGASRGGIGQGQGQAESIPLLAGPDVPQGPGRRTVCQLPGPSAPRLCVPQRPRNRRSACGPLADRASGGATSPHLQHPPAIPAPRAPVVAGAPPRCRAARPGLEHLSGRHRIPARSPRPHRGPDSRIEVIHTAVARILSAAGSARKNPPLPARRALRPASPDRAGSPCFGVRAAGPPHASVTAMGRDVRDPKAGGRGPSPPTPSVSRPSRADVPLTLRSGFDGCLLDPAGFARPSGGATRRRHLGPPAPPAPPPQSCPFASPGRARRQRRATASSSTRLAVDKRKPEFAPAIPSATEMAVRPFPWPGAIPLSCRRHHRRLMPAIFRSRPGAPRQCLGRAGPRSAKRRHPQVPPHRVLRLCPGPEGLGSPSAAGVFLTARHGIGEAISGARHRSASRRRLQASRAGGTRRVCPSSEG